MLAAIGLIVPPLVGIAPILTPLAATRIVVVMIGAVIVHLRHRDDPAKLVMNIAHGAVAAFVAIMRFGPYAF